MASDPINVGGIIYRMDGQQSVNYMYRSIYDFVKTFEPVSKKTGIPLPTIQKLFQKYLNSAPYMDTDYGSIRTKDKDALRKILRAYLEQLKYSKDASGNSIISIMIDRTYINIRELLTKLDGSDIVNDSKLPSICKANKKLVKEITPDIRTLMILELAWLLSHPNKIKSTEECMWAEKVAELSTIRLRDMTKSMETVRQVSDDVEKMDKNDAMKQRIEQLLTIYGVSKLMKETTSETTDTTATNGVKQQGGAIISSRFSAALEYAMNPLFDFIQSKYNPIFHFLESCFTQSHTNKQTIAPQLLTLLHISNYFLSSQQQKSLAQGIYRIRSVHNDLVDFITSHLQCSSAHTKEITSKERELFMETIQQLFPVRISSLPKQKSVSPLVVDKEIPTVVVDKEIPTVRFMTLDGNIMLPPFETFYQKGTEAEKEACYDSITKFITKDDIYMVYSSSKEIPMNLYEIDFSKIDTSDHTIPIKTLTTYFSTHPHFHFQDFATVDEHAIYTNAELVLSIFIALKVPTTQ